MSKSQTERMRQDVEGYGQTLDRFEPDIWPTDPAAYGTSIAISLKRIADELNVANRLEALRQHSDAIVDSQKHAQWLRDHGLGDLIDQLPVDKLGAVVLQAKGGLPQSSSGTPGDNFGEILDDMDTERSRGEHTPDIRKP